MNSLSKFKMFALFVVLILSSLTLTAQQYDPATSDGFQHLITMSAPALKDQDAFKCATQFLASHGAPEGKLVTLSGGMYYQMVVFDYTKPDGSDFYQTAADVLRNPGLAVTELRREKIAIGDASEYLVCVCTPKPAPVQPAPVKPAPSKPAPVKAPKKPSKPVKVIKKFLTLGIAK
jgi:hypothetical protein